MIGRRIYKKMKMKKRIEILSLIEYLFNWITVLNWIELYSVKMNNNKFKVESGQVILTLKMMEKKLKESRWKNRKNIKNNKEYKELKK